MGTRPQGADGAPFVGRDAELAELTARVAAARDGSGALVLVSGPAGIGKTRTVEMATTGAPAVAWGRCVDDPGAPPLWPWRRVVRTLPEVDTAVAGALAGVDLLPDGADPEAARFAVVAAASEALLDAAEPEGLVVVLEDLHWADEASLRLLRHLAGELHRSRLLVVATYRDPAGVDGDLLDRTLPELLRRPTTWAVSLGPLTEDDVRVYLPGAPADTVRAAHRRSGGNPLYLRAVARAPATGAVDGSAELRHLVRATLTALPPPVLDLLDTAAILGEEVEPVRLAAVTSRPLDEVRAGLDVAVRAGVLTAVPDLPGRRRFAHAIVRDAIYADLPPSTREELHRRAAAALEGFTGDDDAGAGIVAGHWLRGASEPEALRRAASWARRAAASATRSLAFEEAARFLAMALDALDRTGTTEAERTDLLLELATAEFRAGRSAESLAHATQTSEAAGSARPDLLAAAALVVHDVAAPDFPPAQIRMCERALAEPAVVASPVLRARLLAQLASTLADAGRPATASAHAAEALRLAEESGDPEAVVDAVRAHMKVNWLALGTAERLRLGLLAIQHAAATGQPLAALWGAKWRIDAALETGDMAGVQDELARVTALAERTRLPLIRWHDLRLRASVAALLGRFAEALDLNEQARAVGTAELSQDVSAAGMSGAFLEQHALVTGELVGWDDATTAVLERAGAAPIVVVSRVLVVLLRGEEHEAAARYGELRGRLTDPDFATSLGVAVNLVPLVEAFGDRETAQALAEHLRAYRYAAGGAGVYCSGGSAGLLGRLAVVRGLPDEAIAHFEEALASDTRIGARPAAAHDRIGLAGALLARGDRADLPRVLELARSALGEARRLGMPGPERQAAELLRRTTAAARAADPLTGRERQIATLVAEALTNRQIAQRLVLSERTVESHVRSILGKLGLANRTELATAVARPAAQSSVPTAR